ncbi:hypothetical protein NDU88_006090 [Pleurodeles waltl]|uniref:Uncharacterized protein n=1 Tax=Pleurodeles waltl TaxID=8319 RepID=A0AAV7MLB7_PLEWA|nr:hypothetical protein NDU88_006090 [Pleurodeles waltl]
MSILGLQDNLSHDREARVVREDWAVVQATAPLRRSALRSNPLVKKSWVSLLAQSPAHLPIVTNLSAAVASCVSAVLDDAPRSRLHSPGRCRTPARCADVVTRLPTSLPASAPGDPRTAALTLPAPRPRSPQMSLIRDTASSNNAAGTAARKVGVRGRAESNPMHSV